MDLLELTLGAQHDMLVRQRRRPVAPLRRFRVRREGFLQKWNELFGTNIAGRAEDHVGRMKRLGVVSQDVIAAEAVDGVGSAEDRTAEGVIRPERRNEDFVYEIVRRVLHHLDLFQNHRSLRLEIGL